MSASYLIKDMPAHDRPRERLLLHGADKSSDAELIAILLRVGSKGVSALQVAQELIKKFGTLGALARASIDELRQVKGVGRDKGVALKAAFTLAQRMARELQADAPALDTPERIADLLRQVDGGGGVERMRIVLLNTRRRLIRVEQLSQGTQDTLLVHPREVFRSAILANAAAIVLAHNHPSGVMPHPVLCRTAHDSHGLSGGERLSHAA